MIAPKIWKLVMWSLNARCTLRMLLHLLSEQTEWNMTTETTGEAVVVAVHSNKELHTGSSSYQWDLSVFQYNWGYRLAVIIEREREGVYVCLSIFIKKKKQLKKKGVVGQEQLLPFAFILQNEGVEWKELLAAGSPYFVCFSRYVLSHPISAKYWKYILIFIDFWETILDHVICEACISHEPFSSIQFSFVPFYVLAWCENCQSCCLPQLCKSQTRSRGCSRSSKEKEACLGVSHLSMELNICCFNGTQYMQYNIS